ncbi:hypothetical protein GP486_004750 [Trichoglossum hirsutum]|uniref:Major facilitator superfamily (MFS) profile domain-containing protein n=1 Tax=Trichoglossum hirsutum TaxID=265104 RepID=A0A9P8LAK5_9PEZI|nr:hypothetical protein GP486_004750 [Trichoglossum hirsutum]
MPNTRIPFGDEKLKLYLTADMKSEKHSSPERASTGVLADEKALSLEGTSKGSTRDVPPDGGLVAWLQVLAGFLLVLNSRGLTNTFGVFQDYYANALLKGTNPSAISWIGSIQTFLLMFGGVFCGRLLDAGHLKVQLCAGISLQFFGTVLASFATRYWQVLVSQGLCVGLGSSFLWLPSVVVIAQYFDTKIMIATGLAATGSSAAGVIYPILIKQLTPHVGFAWAMRIMAFIVLATNSVCLVVMRLRIPPRLNGKFFDISMFRDPPYAAFVAGMTFLYAAVYIPFFYIQDYARYVKMPGGLEIYVLSIMNAASLVSRVIPSWIADNVTSAPGIFALVIIYGLSSGALVSLPPATIASISRNPDEYGIRIGMAFAVCAFGVLVGNPIAGALLSSAIKARDHQPFMRLFYFAGGTMFVATALVVYTRYLVRCCTEADEHESEESASHISQDQYQEQEPPPTPHHHHHVVPTRHGKRWHQVLLEDAIAMQGLSVY